MLEIPYWILLFFVSDKRNYNQKQGENERARAREWEKENGFDQIKEEGEDCCLKQMKVYWPTWSFDQNYVSYT